MVMKWKLISPRVVATPTRLELTPVEAGTGDWVMVASILVFGLAMTMYTTTDWNYRLFGGALYVYLAYTMIADQYTTVIDKTAQEVRITKSTLGYVKWVRVAPTDELVAVETVEEKRKRGGSAWRLELEFMSDHGYYRLPLTETYVLGETNKARLVVLEEQIRTFMKLKQLPDWMKEENLDNEEKRHQRREENAKKR
ncbi:hypothetical protein PhCBS80983_g03897 [Powellomyces hirtus]|uniref:Uncharacterized protein n=1 Tax=Powellomyces hirtus TaxID=109895 RepID=A0A507E2H6_9FUNG|nr:hypothetical protein PhCBS80983_g03897 [Powellomyces hirtus]